MESTTSTGAEVVNHLLRKRARGEISSEVVEEAVSKLLRQVPLDTENYDDDDDEKEEEDGVDHTPNLATADDSIEIEDCDEEDEDPVVTDWNMYASIPLGKQGAQMMTTFGDHKSPDAKAVSATLDGTRRMLQVAIMDARRLRRFRRHEYQRARDDTPLNVSSEIQFRAHQGYDDLSYNPKSGFTIEDLRRIFPEELNAYSRWNEMHEEAAANDDNKEAAQDQEGDATHAKPAAAAESSKKDAVYNGHLRRRASHFDKRTVKMRNKWYLKYSVIRQGSFMKKQRDEKGKKSNHLRFLHWVGFDVNSSLPPPNDETTNALAFLGHDFFGRIVEKAIFLRNRKKLEKHTGKAADEMRISNELRHGERLLAEDIEAAMEDPDIKPEPVQQSKALYFGPGFEDRLEMELEEMMEEIPKEELDLRESETKLFEPKEAAAKKTRKSK